MPTEYQDIQQNNYSEKSYLEKTVKIGAAVAVLNMAENIFKIHSGKLSSLLKGEGNAKTFLKLANTVVAANAVNTDEDTKETFLAATTVGAAMVGFSVFRSHAINNIENYYGGLVSVRNAINNFSKAGAGLGVETIQKIKESESAAEALLSSINIFKKSKAYIVYEKFKAVKQTENNLFNIIKSGYESDPNYQDYFKAREKLNDTFGTVNLDSGFFNFWGRYAKNSKNGIGVDAEKLFKENTNVSFFKSLSEDIQKESDNISEVSDIFYSEMRKNTLTKFGDVFQNLNQKQKDLVLKTFSNNWDEVSQEFINSDTLSNLRAMEFKNQILKQDHSIQQLYEKNQAIKGSTIGEIYKASSLEEKESIKKIIGDKNLDFIKDIKLSSNIITKNGKIYDISFFDFDRMSFDIAKVLEDSFRPVFIMNGKLSSFSPLSVLGLKEKGVRELNKEAISFIRNDIDYAKSIANAEKLVEKLDTYTKLNLHARASFAESENLFEAAQKETSSVIHLMPEDTAKQFKKELEQKIAFLRREAEFEKNELRQYVKGEEVDKRILDFNIKQFHSSSEGKHIIDYNMKEVSKNNIGQFIQDEELFLKQNGKFVKQEGKFHIDFSDAAKEHLSKRNEVSFTEERLGYGKFIEKEIPLEYDWDILKTLIQQGSYKEAFNEIKNSDINFLNTIFNGEKIIAKQISGVVYDPLKFRHELSKLEDLKQTVEGRDITLLNLIETIKTQRIREYERFNKEVDTLYQDISSIYMSKANTLMMDLNNNRAFGSAFFAEADMLYDPSNFNQDRILNMTSEQLLKSTRRASETIVSSGIKDDNATRILKNIEELYQFKQGEEIAITKLIKGAKVKSMFDLSSRDLRGLSDFDKESFYKQLFVKEHFKTVDDKIFSNYVPQLEKNLIYNKEYAFNKIQRRAYNIGEGVIIKTFGSSIDMQKGILNVLKTLKEDLLETKSVNGLTMNANHWLDRLEDTLGGIGIGKMNPHNNKQFMQHFYNIFKKRLIPMYLAYEAYNMIDSAIDASLDDDTPFLGAGLTGAIAKTLAATRIGVQMLMENTGIVGAARAIEKHFPGLALPFNLTSSSEYLKEVYFEGKLEEVKKNRFWFFGGRQNGEGRDFNYWRPHLLYIAQHRDSGIYRNKTEKFFRNDFAITAIPWKLFDPYFEEKVSAFERPYPISEQLFTHVPVIGGMLNATVGQLIKPTKKIRAEEWDVGENKILNPKYRSGGNDPKFLDYNFRDDIFKGANDAWEDAKTWSGMPGYLASVFQEKITGKKSSYQNDSTLASLDQATGLVNGYYDLDLGGMFGHTEGIRRILISNRYKQSFLNPLKNNMPDWMPNNYYIDFKHGDPYRITPFAQYLLPGKTYKENFGLHSDQEYGEYGLLDRLRILSTTAPFSKEYRQYKMEAEQKLSTMNEKDKAHVLQSFAYAERSGKKDIYERNFTNAKVEQGNIGVKEVRSFNEFVGNDNKRYKLVGLETDMNELSKKYSSDEAASILNQMRSKLYASQSISFFINANPSSRVKTDNNGEYIEIYSKEFNEGLTNQKQNYLSNAAKNKGSVLQKTLEAYQNEYKPFYMEKLFSRKDAFHSWYDENIVTPSFRDWNNPYESFVQPMFDISSEGNLTATTSYLMNNSGRTPFLLPLISSAHWIKGRMFGANEVKRYKKEDDMQTKIEFIEHINAPEGYKGANISSIYDMTGEESISKMKGYLSDSEKNFLPYLANETNSEAREAIMSKASDRLQNVLNAVWYRQEKYVNESAEQPTYNELPVYTNMPNVQLTNDAVLNETIIKKILGKKMNSFESKILSKYGNNNYDWHNKGNLNSQVEYVLRNRLNAKTSTLSSITPYNQLKLYNDN